MALRSPQFSPVGFPPLFRLIFFLSLYDHRQRSGQCGGPGLSRAAWSLEGVGVRLRDSEGQEKSAEGCDGGSERGWRVVYDFCGGAAGLDSTSARPAPRSGSAPPRLHVLRLALVSEGPAMARPSRGKGGRRGPSSKLLLLPPEVLVDSDTSRCSRSREH